MTNFNIWGAQRNKYQKQKNEIHQTSFSEGFIQSLFTIISLSLYYFCCPSTPTNYPQCPCLGYISEPWSTFLPTDPTCYQNRLGHSTKPLRKQPRCICPTLSNTCQHFLKISAICTEWQEQGGYQLECL